MTSDVSDENVINKIGENRKNYNISDDGKHVRGRPSSNAQIKIREKIRYYFDNNYNEYCTVQLSGFNKNTVSKYFREFEKILLEKYDQDFVTRHKIALERGLLALNKIKERCINNRLELQKKLEWRYEQIDKTELMKPKFETEIRFLENKLIEYDKLLIDLTDKIARIELEPTADIIIEQHIKEIIEKKNKF